MILSTWDIAGLILAFAVSLTFITTCAVANARLERSRNAWRTAYYRAKEEGWDDCNTDDCHKCHCAECD